MPWLRSPVNWDDLPQHTVHFGVNFGFEFHLETGSRQEESHCRRRRSSLPFQRRGARVSDDFLAGQNRRSVVLLRIVQNAHVLLCIHVMSVALHAAVSEFSLGLHCSSVKDCRCLVHWGLKV